MKKYSEAYEIALLSACLCVSPLSLLGNGPSVYPPPNFFVLYAVRIVSNGSTGLVLPRTSCVEFTAYQLYKKFEW
jgi:hypothetical protein